MRLLLPLLATLVCAGEAAKPPPDPAKLPVREFIVGKYKMLPPPGPAADPVPALDDADRTALAKPTAKTWEQLVERFADRCGATYAAKHPLPEGLAAWFEAHAKERREFWLALDWHFDDIAGAIAILEELRAADAKRFAACFHLAIAIAVVWDQPDALISSRCYPLWGIKPEQLPPAMDRKQVWEWFANERRWSQLRFKPTEMTWPIMVHLVDLGLTPGEAQWAVDQYRAAASDVAALYPEVPYDTGKMKKERPKLGELPYVLSNLKAFGGVCVDQAHFATEIAKALGVPAVKCTGEGRYGGAGHAWTGFLMAKKGRPLLEFTGRYQFDYYYTGEVFDPQRRVMDLDRNVALLYDAATGGHASLVRARALARMAAALPAADAALAGQLATAAVGANAFCREAWTGYFRLAAADAIERKAAIAMANAMVKQLAPHPDLTVDCLPDVLGLFPADQLDPRQRVYESAYAICQQAKRPDLQIRLRQAQCRELADAGKHMDALAKALETVAANADQGGLVLPLVEQIVADAKRFRETVKGFRTEVVKASLDKTGKGFPQKRGDEVSEAWLEFRKLVTSL
jgi:hypothetical protein